jgi:dCTP deaminase
LLVQLRRETGLNQKEAGAAIGFGTVSQLNNIERRVADAVLLKTLRRIRAAYAEAPSIGKLDRLIDGALAWDEVVKVRDTERVEPVYDLEVRPTGRPIENFVAGSGIFVSNTAGFVDAGFSGQLTLELSNVANLPITIYPGMRIGQLCVFKLSSPAENPYGAEIGSKYHGQTGPTPSLYFKNFKDGDQDEDATEDG